MLLLPRDGLLLEVFGYLCFDSANHLLLLLRLITLVEGLVLLPGVWSHRLRILVVGSAGTKYLGRRCYMDGRQRIMQVLCRRGLSNRFDNGVLAAKLTFKIHDFILKTCYYICILRDMVFDGKRVPLDLSLYIFGSISIFQGVVGIFEVNM